MKILYLGNFGNKFSDATEEHIKYAFEQLGHEVIPFPEKKFDVETIIEASREADLFFFHKGGTNFGVSLPQLIEVLNRVTCKKAFWYFDKVLKGEREVAMDALIPFVDQAFLTDGSFIRSRNYTNLYYLNQGIGNEDTSLGTATDKYKADVAFVGSVYDKERRNFAEGLQAVYGSDFKVFNSAFGRDLYDLCATVKILVAPKSLQDDFYWSSRIYMILGSGGFLIHPKFEGMKKEFQDGVHYVGYKNGEELREKIDYYLDPAHEEERVKIQMEGYQHVIDNFTYQDRVKELLDVLNGKKSN